MMSKFDLERFKSLCEFLFPPTIISQSWEETKQRLRERGKIDEKDI